MQSLEQFYDFMREVHTVRRAVTSYYLMQAHTPAHIRSLEQALAAIDEIPGDGAEKRLDAAGHATRVTLDYERDELAKDIFFLGHDDEEFQRFLGRYHGERAQIDLRREVDELLGFLRDAAADVLLTDRDGTVNNYCGRYRSSYQSVWNAVYLTHAARAAVRESVILTSAPLFADGLLELSAMPAATTHYAGSKGREYHSRDGENGSMEITAERAEALDRLNERLRDLLRDERYRVFAIIGSGLQHKYGETAVAHQDIHDSIPSELSDEFLSRVRELVREIDPDGATFAVEDTGKDIEITLTAGGASGFTKGEGVDFLNARLALGLATHRTLVCGDTASDVPMVERAVEIGGRERVAAVFVGADEELQERVQSTGAQSAFVSTPDALVLALHRLAVERGAA